MELSQRKKEILKDIIISYITTGEPVGSKALTEKLKTPVSSATIRNEMNDLEKMGLLEQPHTSAGRIPTGRGYRVYVDSLMEDYQISFEETLLLNSLLSHKDRASEIVLSDMTSLLARMTGYTAITFAKERVGTVQRFEGVYINPLSFLLVMITSSGKAITKQMQSHIPLDANGVLSLVRVLNEHLAKKELGGVTLERLNAMEKDLGAFHHLIGPLMQTIYDTIGELNKVSVVAKGASNLIGFPEFSETETAVEILRELENESDLIRRFFEDFSQRLRVHIGTAGKGLDRASFVACPFRLGKGLEGAIFIVGPQRMDYAKAMARLEYLAKQLQSVHGFEPHLPLIETTKEG